MYPKFVLSVVCLLTAILIGCSGQPTNTDVTNSSVEASPTPQFVDAATAMAEGTRLFDENDIESAITAFEAAVGMQPDLAEGFFKLGVSYALLERQQQQSGSATDTVRTEANGRQTTKRPRSERYFEKAVEAYKKLVKQNPDDDVALFNLGRAYGKLLKDEEAEEHLKKAVKLKPNDSEYQTELGATLIRLAQYRDAVKALKKAAEMDPGNEMIAELLEEAEAGVKRVDFQMPKKDANVAKNPNDRQKRSDGEEAANTSPSTGGDRPTTPANRPAPPANAKPAARAPQPAPTNPTRPRTVDKRGNPSN